jgi:hypothetical protein
MPAVMILAGGYSPPVIPVNAFWLFIPTRLERNNAFSTLTKNWAALIFALDNKDFGSWYVKLMALILR